MVVTCMAQATETQLQDAGRATSERSPDEPMPSAPSSPGIVSPSATEHPPDTSDGKTGPGDKEI